MKYLLAVALVVLLVLGPAYADVNFGSYARSVSMGGAGLALVDDPLTTGAINPAAYAGRKPGFRLVLPSVDFRTQGTSLSDFIDVSSDVQNASGDSAVELARVLGRQNTKVELGAYTGFAVGSLVITADAQAGVELAPSAKFQEWAQNPDAVDWTPYVDSVTGDIDTAALQADYYADVTGRAVAALPAVAFGTRVPGNDAWTVGVRLKALQSSAVFERVQPSTPTVSGAPSDPTISLDLGTAAQPGMQEEIDDSGFGADVGLIYQTPYPNLQLTSALVVTNLLKPDLQGIDLERMISAGAALRLSEKVLLAADLVNITGAYDQNVRLRMGAEVTPVRRLALRACYGSGSFTFGIGFRGMDIAISKETPLVVGRAWNF